VAVMLAGALLASRGQCASTMTVGQSIQPTRDTNICPDGNRVRRIAALRDSDPGLAAKLAANGDCTLAMAPATVKSLGGRAASYSVVAVQTRGLLLVEMDSGGTRISGDAIASDFTVIGPAPLPLPPPEHEYSLAGAMAIGCPSMEKWGELQADPARQYTTVYDISGFVRSHGCELVMPVPGTHWGLIDKSPDGRYLHMTVTDGPNLYYRFNDFVPTPK